MSCGPKNVHAEDIAHIRELCSCEARIEPLVIAVSPALTGWYELRL